MFYERAIRGVFVECGRAPPPVSSRGGIMILASDWNADVKPDIAFVEGGAGWADDRRLDQHNGRRAAVSRCRELVVESDDSDGR